VQASVQTWRAPACLIPASVLRVVIGSAYSVVEAAVGRASHTSREGVIPAIGQSTISETGASQTSGTSSSCRKDVNEAHGKLQLLQVTLKARVGVAESVETLNQDAGQSR
jgi:hypothetical protein